MRNQERIKVLEMVASGKITVEQADQLMEQLSARSIPDGGKRGDYQGKRVGEYSQKTMERIGDSRRTGEADSIRGLRGAGLTDLTVEDVAALNMHHIKTGYIRALAGAGLTDLTVEQIISLNMHQVSAEYVRVLREAGLTDLTAEQVISLKVHQVNAKHVRALAKAGLTDLTVEQIISFLGNRKRTV